MGPDLDAFVEGNAEKFIDNAARDKTWADGTVMQILARVLGMKIVLVNSERAELTILNGGASGTIYLAYYEGLHFQSLTGAPNAEFCARIAATPGAEYMPIDPEDAALFRYVGDADGAEMPSTRAPFAEHHAGSGSATSSAPGSTPA